MIVGQRRKVGASDIGRPRPRIDGKLMIEQILPEQVTSFETFRDPPQATLFPEERHYVSDAVESRQREFTTGRYCARQALRRLGAPAELPLPRDVRGAVIWPDQVAGAITHCRGYRAAAVARVTETVSVGIDAEPNEPLPPGVLEAIALPEEQVMVKELLRDEPRVRWDRVLFSAKESVYKTWYPMTRRFLEFEDAILDLDPLTGEFSARLYPQRLYGIPGAPHEFTGRWMAGNGLVVTAIARPATTGATSVRALSDSPLRGEVLA
jgi:4'-phosphopantetheinyl transferase EntD